MQLGGIAGTQRREETARAALMLGAVVLFFCWPAAVPEIRRCDSPRELRAEADWSVDVSCRAGAGAGGPLRGPGRILFDLPIDLNHANAEALQVLPGIGPGRAAAIIAAREERPLQSLQDLEEIRGIGPKTVARLAAWASADGGGAGEY